MRATIALGQSTTPRLDVLLVEDNPGDASLIRRFLRGGPWRGRVTTADTLRAGLGHLSEARDLVMLDLHLPDGGPRDVIERTIAVAGQTPVVVLTGSQDGALARQCLELGAQDYVVKDELTERSLVRSVEYALARSKVQRLASRLQALERLVPLTQLAAGVIHEISNPATIVYMNSAALLEQMDRLERAVNAGEPPSVDELRGFARATRETLAENLAGLDRVRGLLGGLRRLARPEDEALPEAETADLSEIAREIVSTVSHHVARHARLVVELRPAPVRVARRRVGQLLLNLVMNAMHAMETIEREHVLRISTRVESGVAIAEVSDTGCGIATKDLERIFDWFFTTRSSNGGSGVGLALSRAIAVESGGTLTARSENGTGTTFTLRLPLAA